MRVLITGNMGYVGPVAAQELQQTRPDAVLVGLDLGFFGHCLTGAAFLPERLYATQHFLDVRRVPDALLEGFDAVVHLAAVSNDPIGNAFEEATRAVNYQSSVDLARQAKRAGVSHFVFASSCSLYGAGGDAPRTEDAVLTPLTAYARSKDAAEQELKTLAGDDPSLPYLKVGRQLIKGFEPSAYDSNLDLAGYPKASGSSGATP